MFGVIIAVAIGRLIWAKKIFVVEKQPLFSLFSFSFLVAFLGVFVVSFFYSIEEYFVLWTLFALSSTLYYQAKALDEEKP